MSTTGYAYTSGSEYAQLLALCIFCFKQNLYFYKQNLLTYN
ncbi:hypothetical protein GXM_02125 [Nostoc sphaeroides CCNUC1]|uniref:Uncharacterized protein n=1 Tax=Nostoc sphaeroides CCNUC1 TaxID=2653204 RepID=A0A5P8VW87_9NOSO|nr:hypothetical protein GXM_02125 [Nostoc sphaeroides CCNUC1]